MLRLAFGSSARWGGVTFGGSVAAVVVALLAVAVAVVVAVVVVGSVRWW